MTALPDSTGELRLRDRVLHVQLVYDGDRGPRLLDAGDVRVHARDLLSEQRGAHPFQEYVDGRLS
eukprot:369602-Rhodomonas_salina.1